MPRSKITKKKTELFDGGGEFPPIPIPPSMEERILKTPEQRAEYDAQRIKATARDLVPDAFKTLEQILKKDGEFYKDASVTQRLDAVKLVFDRAGDRAATAVPEDDKKTRHFAIMDKSVMPQKNARPN